MQAWLADGEDWLQCYLSYGGNLDIKVGSNAIEKTVTGNSGIKGVQME